MYDVGSKSDRLCVCEIVVCCTCGVGRSVGEGRAGCILCGVSG